MEVSHGVPLKDITREWQACWGVSDEALRDLERRMYVMHKPPEESTAVNEAQVLARTRSTAYARHGAVLWRNNVGGTRDGRVRYGLCNDSKQINRRFKSSDAIGITPIVVTPDMVGRTLGVFTALEVKRPGWRYTGTLRERAQLNYLILVLSLGGIGRFINDDGQI